MWTVVGRIEASDVNDDGLRRTARAIADGADEIPGHMWTRLVGTQDRQELLCVSMWDIEGSAKAFIDILKEQRSTVLAGYDAELADFTLYEDIAAFAPGEP